MFLGGAFETKTHVRVFSKGFLGRRPRLGGGSVPKVQSKVFERGVFEVKAHVGVLLKGVLGRRLRSKCF